MKLEFHCALRKSWQETVSDNISESPHSEKVTVSHWDVLSMVAHRGSPSAKRIYKWILTVVAPAHRVIPPSVASRMKSKFSLVCLRAKPQAHRLGY
ncbi:Uncharacterised protein [Vibrio cholerae]|nr:Uncharacterised protein [Vibrio cholerae]